MKLSLIKFFHSIGLSNLSDRQINDYSDLITETSLDESNSVQDSSEIIDEKTLISYNSELLSPIVPLNKIIEHKDLNLFAKVDALNPTSSVKYNMAKYILNVAEERGIISHGGIIIESIQDQETGRCIAQLAIKKGLKFICSVSSKVSMEAIDILRCFGATVYVCPAHVSADNPRSFYQVAKRLHSETPNSIYLNLTFNELNQEAHYKFTGPEIWNQMNQSITHFLSPIRTGGTISGVGRYLKEMNPEIKIIGVDAYGSVIKKYFETGEFDSDEIYPYRISIGNNLIPTNLNCDVIDSILKVTDEESAHITRLLALKEGLFIGYSSGAVYQAFLQLTQMGIPKKANIVLYFPDNGYNDLSKVYSNEWMINQGFSEEIKEIKQNLVYIK